MLAQSLSAHDIGAGGLGFKSWVGQIGSASVANGSPPMERSFGAISTGATLRRWATSLVTRFGVFREYNKDLFFLFDRTSFNANFGAALSSFTKLSNLGCKSYSNCFIVSSLNLFYA